MNVSGRTRTYSWEDPMALRDAGAGLSGLDYLKAVVRLAAERPDLGPDFVQWLRTYVAGSQA